MDASDGQPGEENDYWVAMFLTQDNCWESKEDLDLDNQPGARLQYLSKIAQSLCRTKKVLDKYRARADTGELHCSARCHSKQTWLVFLWAHLARELGVVDLRQLAPLQEIVGPQWEPAISTELVERVTSLGLADAPLIEHSCGTSLTQSFCPAQPVVKEVYVLLAEFNKNLMNLEKLVKKVGDGGAMNHLQLVETLSKAIRCRDQCQEFCLQMNTQAYFLRLQGRRLEGRKFWLRSQGFITTHTSHTVQEALQDGFDQSLTEFLASFGIIGVAGFLKPRGDLAANSKFRDRLEEQILIRTLSEDPRVSTPLLERPPCWTCHTGGPATNEPLLRVKEEVFLDSDNDDIEIISGEKVEGNPKEPEPGNPPPPSRPSHTMERGEVVWKEPPLGALARENDVRKAGNSKTQGDSTSKEPLTSPGATSISKPKETVSGDTQTTTRSQEPREIGGPSDAGDEGQTGKRAKSPTRPSVERKGNPREDRHREVSLDQLSEDWETFHDRDLYQGRRLGGREYEVWLNKRKFRHLFGQWAEAGVFEGHPRIDWEQVEMREVAGPSGPHVNFYLEGKEIGSKIHQAAIDRRQGVDYLRTPFELTIHIQRFRDSPNRNHTGLQIAVGYWAYYLRQALNAYPEPVRCEICPTGGSSNYLLFGLEALKAHLINVHKLKYRECTDAAHKDYDGKKGGHFSYEQVKVWDKEAKEIGRQLACHYGVYDKVLLTKFKDSRPDKGGHGSNPNPWLGSSNANKPWKSPKPYRWPTDHHHSTKPLSTKGRRGRPEVQEKRKEDCLSSPSKQQKRSHDFSPGERAQKQQAENAGIIEPLPTEVSRSEGSESGILSLDSFHNERPGSGITVELSPEEAEEDLQARGSPQDGCQRSQ